MKHFETSETLLCSSYHSTFISLYEKTKLIIPRYGNDCLKRVLRHHGYIQSRGGCWGYCGACGSRADYLVDIRHYAQINKKALRSLGGLFCLT